MSIFGNISDDLRFALRQLRRSPGLAVTAILTLALGIGANTAIFSLLDQALLRALPVRDPGSLVVLEGTGSVWEGSTHTHGGAIEAYFSYPMYKDLRDRNQAFEGLIGTAPAPAIRCSEPSIFSTTRCFAGGCDPGRSRPRCGWPGCSGWDARRCVRRCASRRATRCSSSASAGSRSRTCRPRISRSCT